MNDRDSLLDRPPEVAIRLLALSSLDEASAAAGLLESDAGGGALHDFRVALRRLRTLLKAYRGLFLASVSKKQARALRDLARSTGAARDAEVQLDWLATLRDDLRPGARRAWSWIVTRLESRRQAAYSAVRDDVLGRFRHLERQLRSGLARHEATVAPDPARATFALAAGEMVRCAGTELVTALEAVRAPTDAEEAHHARIQAKRLRYLLEPLRVTSLEHPVDRLVSSAKRVQEVLGNLHDMHVLAAEIESSLVETAAEHARTLHEALYVTGPTSPGRDLRSGILAIDRLVRDRVEGLFQELRSLWPEQREAFSAGVEALAVALGHNGHGEPGRGRRFLLESLPAIAASPMDIAQGWIPGGTVQERLERVASGGKERFYRAVRDGSGASRTELAEEASREVFERLWPLTQGHQVLKRRFKFARGEQVWEVDEFLDRRLVMAQTAPNGSPEEMELPDWLAPHVVREVTGEEQYLDENLAR